MKYFKNNSETEQTIKEYSRVILKQSKTLKCFKNDPRTIHFAAEYSRRDPDQNKAI